MGGVDFHPRLPFFCPGVNKKTAAGGNQRLLKSNQTGLFQTSAARRLASASLDCTPTTVSTALPSLKKTIMGMERTLN